MSNKKRSKVSGKKVSHGVYSWLKTGRINPSIRGYKRLQKYLEGMERILIDDQGGSSEITGAKEILIKGTVEAFGVFFLAIMYCKKEGILRPDLLEKGIVSLQPVLGNQFIAFMNTIRQNLVALGLEKKKADEVLDLKKYIKEKYGKNNKEQTG